jgi:hypothetical protein
MRSMILPGMLLLAAACIAVPAVSQDSGPADRPGAAPPAAEGVLPRDPASPPTTAPLPRDRPAASGSEKSGAAYEGAGDNFGPPDGIPGGPAKTSPDAGGSGGGAGGSFTGEDQRPDKREGR